MTDLSGTEIVPCQTLGMVRGSKAFRMALLARNLNDSATGDIAASFLVASQAVVALLEAVPFI